MNRDSPTTYYFQFIQILLLTHALILVARFNFFFVSVSLSLVTLVNGEYCTDTSSSTTSSSIDGDVLKIGATFIAFVESAKIYASKRIIYATLVASQRA